MARRKFSIIKSKSPPVYNPQIILYKSKDNTLMDQKAPLEITKLDAQIAQAGGTTSGIDMLPSQLQKTKRNLLRQRRDDLP